MCLSTGVCKISWLDSGLVDKKDSLHISSHTIWRDLWLNKRQLKYVKISSIKINSGWQVTKWSHNGFYWSIARTRQWCFSTSVGTHDAIYWSQCGIQPKILLQVQPVGTWNTQQSTWFPTFIEAECIHPATRKDHQQSPNCRITYLITEFSFTEFLNK